MSAVTGESVVGLISSPAQFVHVQHLAIRALGGSRLLHVSGLRPYLAGRYLSNTVILYRNAL